jgi:hypothetical protein
MAYFLTCISDAEASDSQVSGPHIFPLLDYLTHYKQNPAESVSTVRRDLTVSDYLVILGLFIAYRSAPIRSLFLRRVQPCRVGFHNSNIFDLIFAQ